MKALLYSTVASAFIGLSLAAPTATVKNGTYVGEYLPTFNQDAFLGIPFAQVPTGQLRFRAPASLNTSWSGERSAVEYGNSCYAFGPYTDNNHLIQSEDCLTLNVVRPTGYSGQKLPVGIWIYGGGFDQGASSRDLYNLSYPVEQSIQGETPVLAVSINYRIGPFGFFASKEVLDAGEMNLGLKDQLLAIRWVKENIEAFGGDPNQITIWGESAGGESVAMHLFAYGGKLEGLFQGAIMESGSATTQQYYPVSHWQSQYDKIIKLTGCNKQKDSLECLRTVDIQKLVPIVNVTNGIITENYSPTVDGDYIPDWPKNLLAQGRFVRVPMISGANLDEGTSFGPGNVNTTKQVQQFLRNFSKSLTSSSINTLLRLYPNVPALGAPYGTGDLYSNETFGLQYKRGASIGGDLVMVGPRRLMCETWSKAGAVVYSYNWNQSDYTTPVWIGSTHFQEVVYVFDNPSPTFPQSSAAPMGPDPTGAKKRLGDQISRFFMSFIATGDPNNAKQSQNYPSWPKYSIDNPQNYYFHESDTHVEADTWRKAGIEFINYGVGHQLLN